ncbi:hypothetical protein [Pararobbsia silviterrae]|nr:hypothetical protein [Pararobbsia silviterrae]
MPRLAPGLRRYAEPIEIRACAERTTREASLYGPPGPTPDEPYPASASMDVIEAYVDVIRRAQGKPTLAEIDPGMPHYETHLEDFVRDVFRTMTLHDHG